MQSIKEEIDISHDIVLSFETVTQRFSMVQALCDAQINDLMDFIFHQIHLWRIGREF